MDRLGGSPGRRGSELGVKLTERHWAGTRSEENGSKNRKGRDRMRTARTGSKGGGNREIHPSYIYLYL